VDIDASGGPDLLPGDRELGRLGRFSDPFRAAAERLDGGRRRALYWALRLMADDRVGKYARLIPGFRYAAFGFLDPHTEANDFGVTLVISPMVAWPFTTDGGWPFTFFEGRNQAVGTVETEVRGFSRLCDADR
jgi:hypothetical protein